MSDDLSIQGTLAETTVPDLFRSLVRSSETGMLSLEVVGRNYVIYFQEGRLIFATSSDPDLSLGEILLRGGELSLQQYFTAMERVVMTRRVGAVKYCTAQITRRREEGSRRGDVRDRSPSRR